MSQENKNNNEIEQLKTTVEENAKLIKEHQKEEQPKLITPDLDALSTLKKQEQEQREQIEKINLEKKIAQQAKILEEFNKEQEVPTIIEEIEKPYSTEKVDIDWEKEMN